MICSQQLSLENYSSDENTTTNTQFLNPFEIVFTDYLNLCSQKKTLSRKRKINLLTIYSTNINNGKQIHRTPHNCIILYSIHSTLVYKNIVHIEKYSYQSASTEQQIDQRVFQVLDFRHIIIWVH